MGLGQRIGSRAAFLLPHFRRKDCRPIRKRVRYLQRKRRLEEIADLLAELHNVAAGQTAAIGQPMAKARVRTRVGRRRDLPKIRQVLDTPISLGDRESMDLVEAAQAEVAAMLGG